LKVCSQTAMNMRRWCYTN